MQETQETWVWSLGWEGPLEEEMATHSSVLAWRIHGQRGLAGYSPWGHKESDMTEWAHKDILEELCVLDLFVIATSVILFNIYPVEETGMDTYGQAFW